MHDQISLLNSMRHKVSLCKYGHILHTACNVISSPGIELALRVNEEAFVAILAVWEHPAKRSYED